MPNPKRRHSQQRSAKRRTHYIAETVTLSKDTTTGETHVRHRAHVSEGKEKKEYINQKNQKNEKKKKINNKKEKYKKKVKKRNLEIETRKRKT